MTYGYYSNLPLSVTSAVGRAGAIYRPLDSRGDVRNRIALAAVNAYIKHLNDDHNTKDTPVNPEKDMGALDSRTHYTNVTESEYKLILALRAERETKAEYDRKAKVAVAAHEATDEAYDKWQDARDKVTKLKNAL